MSNGALNIANLVPSQNIQSSAGQSGYIQSNGILLSANLNNAAADQPITMLGSKYLLRQIWFTNASTSLAVTLATFGLYTASGGGGSNLLTSVPLTSLVVAGDLCIATLSATASVKIRTEAILYLRGLVAHGGAATADVYLISDIGA